MRATPPGGRRGSIGVVFVLVVLVAFPEVKPPDPDFNGDPNADPDAETDDDPDDANDAAAVIVVPDCKPEAELLVEADWLAVELEASSASSFWCSRRTSKASILLSRDSGHGHAKENAVERNKMAERAGRNPEPFMSDGERCGLWDIRTVALRVCFYR